MSWFANYVRSSIGKKQVMAVTGLGLVLFAIVHMVGHLGMFAGQDGYNSYAAFLQGLGALKWKLVNPANKRKYTVIVVGQRPRRRLGRRHAGRARLQREGFCFQDSPRRAHSIAAQGGINAAKNYQNDGDSVYRLFYDTVKGGDFRAREANVYRLAQVSVNIIDQCVAQGVPFAREYGGLLANRSFGGAQVSRTFYARGQTGQQLLLGAYQALMRQIGAGKVKMFRARDARRGRRRRRRAAASSRATWSPARSSRTRRRGGAGHRRLRQRLLPVDQRQGLQRHRDLARAQARARSSPTPATRRSTRPASRSAATTSQAHADVASRCATTAASGCRRRRATSARPRTDPEAERDYYLERKYPSFGNLVPRDIASRNAKEACDEGRGVGPAAWRLPRLPRRHQARGRGRRSPSATATCSRCTSASPARTRTRCRCASTRPCTTRWAGCGSTTT
jgi:succinate dehydrogenase / fumarate reductase flavoprotein subunit